MEGNSAGGETWDCPTHFCTLKVLEIMCSWWKTCSWTFWDWTRAWTTWQLSSRQDPDPGYSNAVLAYTYIGTAVVVILIESYNIWEIPLLHSHSWDRVRILILGTEWEFSLLGQVKISVPAPSGKFPYFAQINTSPTIFGKYQKKHLKQIFIVVKISESNTTQLVLC